MENVLYELHYEFSTFMICAFLILTAFFVFILCWFHRKDSKAGKEYGSVQLFRGKKLTINQEKKFIAVFLIVMLLIAGVLVFANWKTYDSLNEKYEAGKYEEVYGCVEAFVGGIKFGRGKESRDFFNINGIEFSINPNSLLPAGYTKIRDNGGVITGDGQHLHIKYINRYVGNVVERYIVYIAEIEEKGNQ